MTVRSKLKCTQVIPSQNVDGSTTAENIVFEAIYDNDDPTNKTWSKYTPSARFNINITNPDLLGNFKVGSYYYVDIMEVK
jgi:hypothetical protein